MSFPCTLSKITSISLIGIFDLFKGESSLLFHYENSFYLFLALKKPWKNNSFHLFLALKKLWRNNSFHLFFALKKHLHSPCFTNYFCPTSFVTCKIFFSRGLCIFVYCDLIHIHSEFIHSYCKV